MNSLDVCCDPVLLAAIERLAVKLHGGSIARLLTREEYFASKLQPWDC
jgi:hypothetical protein